MVHPSQLSIEYSYSMANRYKPLTLTLGVSFASIRSISRVSSRLNSVDVRSPRTSSDFFFIRALPVVDNDSLPELVFVNLLSGGGA